MIPELLRTWRHANHMTIEEAAKRLDLTWDVYRRAEIGKPMAPATFMKIMGWICGTNTI